MTAEARAEHDAAHHFWGSADPGAEWMATGRSVCGRRLAGWRWSRIS